VAYINEISDHLQMKTMHMHLVKNVNTEFATRSPLSHITPTGLGPRLTRQNIVSMADTCSSSNGKRLLYIT
jgi:hypothetical protein